MSDRFYSSILELFGTRPIDRGGLRSAANQTREAVSSIIQGIRNSQIEPRHVDASGVRTAQVLMAYDASHSKRPPNLLFDRADEGDSVPWIVARCEDTCKHLPNPAKYNEGGSPMEQYNYYSSLLLHYSVGIFLPIDMTPDYPIPGKGQLVKVQFANPNRPHGGYYIFGESNTVVSPTSIPIAREPSDSSQSMLEVNFPDDSDGNQIPEPS